MKKLVVIVLTLAMMLSACSAGANAPANNPPATPTPAAATASPEPTEAPTAEPTPAPTEEPTEAPTPEPTPAGLQQDKGTLGSYDVTIVSATLDKTYDGKPAVVVTYEWTNNSDKAASFMFSLMPKVFQDGIECGTAILGMKSKADTKSSLTEIKPGKTLKVQAAYELQDKTKPISVEVTELISFDDTTKVVKDFNLK